MSTPTPPAGAKPAERPAEYATLVAGVVAALVLVGLDADAAAAVGALILGVLPGLVTLLNVKLRGGATGS